MKLKASSNAKRGFITHSDLLHDDKVRRDSFYFVSSSKQQSIVNTSNSMKRGFGEANNEDDTGTSIKQPIEQNVSVVYKFA